MLNRQPKLTNWLKKMNYINLIVKTKKYYWMTNDSHTYILMCVNCWIGIVIISLENYS